MVGVTIAHSLLPQVLKKKFLFEMINNDICLGSVRKQNAPFFTNVPTKNAPCLKWLEQALVANLHNFPQCNTSIFENWNCPINTVILFKFIHLWSISKISIKVVLLLGSSTKIQEWTPQKLETMNDEARGKGESGNFVWGDFFTGGENLMRDGFSHLTPFVLIKTACSRY